LITTLAPIIIYFNFGIFWGGIYLFGIVLIRIMVSLASKQSVFENLIYMIPQHFLFLLIIGKGIANYKKKELLWKGRNILQD
jgi:hypothetical protein